MYSAIRASALAVIATTVLLLGGCATPPEYAKAENPFNSLTPKSNRALSGLKLCLMLSGNTNKSVSYLNDLTAKLGRLGNDASDSEPKKRVGDLTEMLNNRFREVVTVNDLPEAQRQQCALSLALDIRVQVGSISFASTSVDMSGVFADVRGTELDTLTGSGKGTVPYPATNMGVSSAWGRALAALGEKIDHSEPILRLASAAPKAVAAAPTTATPPAKPRTGNTSPARIEKQAVIASPPPAPVAAQISAPVPPSAGPVVFAPRKALVIGNDNYRQVTKLTNAAFDAQAISASLKSVGYQVFMYVNLDEKAFKQALRDFRLQIEGGDEVVFFFAGHGIQIGAANYLLPVDIQGGNEEQVKDEAIQLQRVLDDLQEKRAKFALAIIDACRDNPFKGSGRAIGGRGLAPTTAATGQMIMFSAGSGQQALDKLGDQDPQRNGLFTRVLVREMVKPGVTVDRVLRNVRNEVVSLAKGVGHEQTPALYDQAVGDFYFKR